MTEDEMVGRHQQLSGHESEQILGDSEGQGILTCCSPWGHRVRHDLVTEQQQLHMSVHSSFIQNSKRLHNPNAL